MRNTDIPIDRIAKSLFVRLAIEIDKHEPLSLEDIAEDVPQDLSLKKSA